MNFHQGSCTVDDLSPPTSEISRLLFVSSEEIPRGWPFKWHYRVKLLDAAFKAMKGSSVFNSTSMIILTVCIDFGRIFFTAVERGINITLTGNPRRSPKRKLSQSFNLSTLGWTAAKSNEEAFTFQNNAPSRKQNNFTPDRNTSGS